MGVTLVPYIPTPNGSGCHIGRMSDNLRTLGVEGVPAVPILKSVIRTAGNPKTTLFGCNLALFCCIFAWLSNAESIDQQKCDLVGSLTMSVGHPCHIYEVRTSVCHYVHCCCIALHFLPVLAVFGKGRFFILFFIAAKC